MWCGSGVTLWDALRASRAKSMQFEACETAVRALSYGLRQDSIFGSERRQGRTEGEASQAEAHQMPAHCRVMIATWGLLALAVAVSFGPKSGLAQSSPQAAPEATEPALPDGFIVNPPRPLVPLPRFQFDYRAPSSGSEPSSGNPPMGCQYDERKLELIV